MATKKNKVDLSELSKEELLEKLEMESERLQKLKFSHAISPLENTNVLKEIRKDIARFNTELKARELAE